MAVYTSRNERGYDFLIEDVSVLDNIRKAEKALFRFMSLNISRKSMIDGVIDESSGGYQVPNGPSVVEVTPVSGSYPYFANCLGVNRGGRGISDQ
ncbi:MAG: hypothetical protein WA782_07725 [Sulfitobacter sp.]